MASSIRVDEANISTATINTLQIPSGSLDRGLLMQDALAVYELPIGGWRVHDAYTTLITAAGNDDLGITTPAFGTAQPYLTTGDVKNVTNTLRYARQVFTLPPEYDDANSVTLRLYAGMASTVTAATSCTVDAEAYEIDKDSITAVTGSDLVSDAAQSINSAAIAAKDFTITPTGLVAGDALDIRIAIAANDNQTTNAVTACIPRAELLLDVRG